MKMVMDRNYDPVIIFSFSKRDCERYAMKTSKIDFTSEDEKKLVSEVFHNAIDSLSEDDKKLPQVESILPLLMRGVGIHHGGLLPIIKARPPPPPLAPAAQAYPAATRHAFPSARK